MPEEPKQELTQVAPGTVLQPTAGSGSDFDDYKTLEAGEPLEAYIYDVRVGKKLKYQSQTEFEDRLYLYCKISTGEGEGQVYRGDMPLKWNGPGAKKPSKLTQFIYLIGADVIDDANGLKLDELRGWPLRIELCEPVGEKGFQFIDEFKKPKPSQKKSSDVAEIHDSIKPQEELPTDSDVEQVNLDDIPF